MTEHKVFRCHRCGAERMDWEVFGIGDRAYCSFPDHRPAFRLYLMFGRPRVWLRARDNRRYR